MIWKNQPSLETLNSFSANTLVDHLGIEFTDFGEDYLIATMPVDHRTTQPMRLLHGGASVALAETLGSVASTLCIDLSIHHCVGVEINANHVSSAKEGEKVVGTVKPIKIGRKIHVWNIEIHNENGKLMCVSRITIAVIERRI